MRIPIPFVLLLCVAVIGGVWWYNTHDLNFMTPPTEEKLAEIRARVEASVPQQNQPDDAVSEPPAPPPPPPVVEAPPTQNLGDLGKPPELDDYADLAANGAAALMKRATALEFAGESQRALLAWERVLDSTNPEKAEAETAIAAIRRLRPTLADWNTSPAQATAVTLHAGTGRKTADALGPLLEETAREIERSSAGILTVTAKVTAGGDATGAPGPAPVALWLTGISEDSTSTGVLSFTVDSQESLPEELQKTVFSLIRGHLSLTGSHTAPPARGKDDPKEALGSHITRLRWQEFGNLLNKPPNKNQ